MNWLLCLLQVQKHKYLKTVLIIYKFLPQYRVDFYNRLKVELLKNDIKLEVIYGNSNKNDKLKNDEIHLTWAKFLKNRRLRIGKKEIVWQPCLRFLKNKDLIIVQPEEKLILNYILMTVRRRSSFKLCFWGHVYNMQKPLKTIHNQYKNIVNKNCDWWFAYTESARGHLIKIGYPESRITVVNNAIDTLGLINAYINIESNIEKALKSELNISGNNVALYCGSLYPEKDIEFILNVCNRVKTKIPDFQMIFIGSGIEAGKVIEASSKSNWIHYVGAKFGEEKIKYFKISSIQLIPKLVGLTILDSFALQTPIITMEDAFHGPEIDYLKNGVNGIATKNNIEDYTDKVISILANKTYISMAQAGLKSAQEYTIENMVENFKCGILLALNN